MQTIKNIDGQFVLTVTDDKYPNRIASKNISPESWELYKNIYTSLRKELNQNLIFYVNPTLTVNEWGLGLPGLRVTNKLEVGKDILWITPYFIDGKYNCIAFRNDHLPNLRNSASYNSTMPNNYGARTGLCHFAGYKVFEQNYKYTGGWFFIYIDKMDNFDKVVELIKGIGIWN